MHIKTRANVHNEQTDGRKNPMHTVLKLTSNIWLEFDERMIPPAIHSLSFIGSDRKLLLVGFNCDRVRVRHKVDLLAVGVGSEKYMAENKHKPTLTS